MQLDKKSMIKEAIRLLHAGVPPEKVKEQFRQVLESMDSLEIAKIEEELVKEGLKREEMQKLCDVHLALFRDQLEKQPVKVAPTRPIKVLMEEHRIMLQLAEQLTTLASKLLRINDETYAQEELHQIFHIAGELGNSEKHYLREENVLFPLIEKHGITEPPAIMWMEHDQIRERKKKLLTALKNREQLGFKAFKEQLWEDAKTLLNTLTNHFYKENNILFPTALNVVTAVEWSQAKEEFDEIGYCSFTPKELTVTAPVNVKPASTTQQAGLIQFETGSLTLEQLEGILETLPVDITFVDAEDTVRYFSRSDRRIFVRSKAVIGRKVQNCHPEKSIHIVNRIIESFKAGEKNVAEFWINLHNRLVYIRYFAVRNRNGKYLGTLEVSQDVTSIKTLEGEKRLLDWEA